MRDYRNSTTSHTSYGIVGAQRVCITINLFHALVGIIVDGGNSNGCIVYGVPMIV